ncbi:MAG TPA: zinc-dependent metalloprotease [Acidimicrobiales bacterium]|nr:zinc-dependent metalloprotease [Acidimicrobiales bacterium]
MDPDLPPGMGGFFQGLLGDLLRLMRTDSPVQWELAAQLALSIASDNTSEPNVDPLERIRLEELMRVAELHVSDVTGIPLTTSGRPLQVVPTGRAEWARRSLGDWRPLIEQIAASIAPFGSKWSPSAPGSATSPGAATPHPPGTGSPGKAPSSPAGSEPPAAGGDGAGREAGSEPPAGDGPGRDAGSEPPGSGLGGLAGLGDLANLGDLGNFGDLGGAMDAWRSSEPLGSEPESTDFAALLGQWTTAVAPAMIAMQVGSVVGHLARRALGQYELPLPRSSESELLVVPANVDQFAGDWSLPADDVRLWLIVRDLVAHAVLNRPPVRRRVEALLIEHARGIHPDPTLLDARLGELSGDLSDLTRLLGDPTALGTALDTPETRRVRAALSAVEAAIAGYVEWATEVVAGRAIGARLPVAEAMRRRRVERGGEERAAEALFGLRLDQEQVDRGLSFVRGVVERAGSAELEKLWLVEGGLPTPAEIDAPGLWVERVNLPDLDAATDARNGTPGGEGTTGGHGTPDADG